MDITLYGPFYSTNIYAFFRALSGQSWSACSTEGLLVYAINPTSIFNPFDLDMEVKPAAIRRLLYGGAQLDDADNREMARDYNQALVMALKLNDPQLIREVLECVPAQQQSAVVRGLPFFAVAPALLDFLAAELEASAHVDFYAGWCRHVLFVHGVALKSNSRELMPSINHIIKALTRKRTGLNRLVDANVHAVRYLTHAAELKRAAKATTTMSDVSGHDVMTD